MRLFFRNFPLLLAPALLVLAGCGNSLVTATPAISAFSITPRAGSIDTNCTGCNAVNLQGNSVQQFTATLPGGRSADIVWSVSGGDAVSGPGSINQSGQYTPPGYLTADRAVVVVTATLVANPSLRAYSVLTVTPGFLQPLTPENAALGANGTITITGILAEAGGSTGIHFELSGSANGQGGGQGSLGAMSCQRDSQSFTSCTVTYSAPPSVQSTGATYVVATVDGASFGPGSRAAAVVLVNSAGVTSNPATHQGQPLAMVLLGSSGGNNNDYDTRGNQIVDCCSGTLGALIEDAGNRPYILSNNHVLANSDHASVGDTIIQPGLIDNNCTPLGEGSGVQPVASLSGWLPLRSKQTNADAAIAQVTSRAVDPSGNILELGGRQTDGTLAAAPPGISSTGGRGEAATLTMTVAKSGRTTGLTCGGISAVDLDVTVDYYLDCAETRPYLTKTFTHQLGLSGNQYSDAGDSGALVVDVANAEPVGLYFAGGTDLSGVSQGVANPATDVLAELGAQFGESYTFVGAADHAVNCLNYGDNTIPSAQARTLSDTETARAQQALWQARMLVSSATGILGVATGKSSDHPGEAAVILYTDESRTVNVPSTVDGVRTIVIPTTARAVAYGSAPQNPFETGAVSLPSSVLAQAVTVKNQVAANLMQQNPAFFGVGVGQSLDNPREAALVIYVDRNRLPSQLPATVDGLRARYIVMDRLHVTRSYAAPTPLKPHCKAHTPTSQPARFDLLDAATPSNVKLN
ncbi:MAG TPA: hypothetical protein VKF63_11080 [Terracidiphilus sp.]|nr:hypothetical protein [Terracidiphilus sp.]